MSGRPLTPALTATWKKSAASALALSLALCVGSPAAWAQDFGDVSVAAPPLTLKSRGSFYVGGKAQAQTPVQQGTFGEAPPAQTSDVAIDQMYVEFMIPQRRARAPLVLIHGSTLTGKTWDTTPDGRTGWYEYLVRKGYPTYVVDYAGRGRSGFDQSTFNEVRAGAKPPQALPEIRRFSASVAWTNFRFGPALGSAFPGEKFPVAFAGRLADQSLPDIDTLYQAENYAAQTAAITTLSKDLGGAVLIGHSQGALFPTEVALHGEAKVKAIVLLESCSNAYSDAQIKVLAKTPLLSVWGDNLDNPTGIQGWSWRYAFNECEGLTRRLRAAGGRAENIYLPDRGVRGNSHMLMMDSNSLQLADMVSAWLDKNVR